VTVFTKLSEKRHFWGGTATHNPVCGRVIIATLLLLLLVQVVKDGHFVIDPEAVDLNSPIMRLEDEERHQLKYDGPTQQQ